MLNVGDIRLRDLLGEKDDALCHIIGRQPGVTPDGSHNRNVDVWKDIDRDPQRGKDAQQQDQQGQHHEGVRTLQSDLSQPHGCEPSLSFSRRVSERALLWRREVCGPFQAAPNGISVEIRSKLTARETAVSCSRGAAWY